MIYKKFPTLLKAKDLQQILSVGRDKAYALMKSDDFPSIKIGRDYYVTEENLRLWLEESAGKEIEL